jgi:hypothetical protein
VHLVCFTIEISENYIYFPTHSPDIITRTSEHCVHGLILANPMSDLERNGRMINQIRLHIHTSGMLFSVNL